MIVQDTLGGGRILLLADAWAWNGGLFQHLADASGGTEMRSVARGDGFCTIGGKKYLLLSDQNRKGNANGQTGNINENTDRSRFNYAADIYGAPDENGRYPVYHLNGTPRAYKAVGTPVSDANLSLGGMSAYSLTKEYELCRDGTLLTASYSMRIHPFYKTLQSHQGVDYTIPEGSSVFATADGVVRDVATRNSTHGLTVVIDHGNGYETSYSHLSKTNVRRGQQVRRGDIIALSGDTGLSLSPHLHYEVRHNGMRVDPIHYFFMELSPTEYQRLIRIAQTGMQAFD